MPLPDLEIRPIERGDEADWRRLWAGYLDYYETKLPEAVYASTFARLLTYDIREPRGMLALAGGRPAGLTHYIFHRHCWRIEDTCYLQDLYAEPEVRGRGVGRALIEAVYSTADAEGAVQVYWLTQEFNTTARKPYDRIGVATPFIKYQRRA